MSKKRSWEVACVITVWTPYTRGDGTPGELGEESMYVACRGGWLKELSPARVGQTITFDTKRAAFTFAEEVRERWPCAFVREHGTSSTFEEVQCAEARAAAAAARAKARDRARAAEAMVGAFI